MTEVRAADLLAGDIFAECGMDPVRAAAVSAHGDTVLITGMEGEELALDRDTVVELLHRTAARRGAA